MKQGIIAVFWIGVVGFYLAAAYLLFARLAQLQFDSQYTGGM